MSRKKNKGLGLGEHNKAENSFMLLLFSIKTEYVEQ